ncbi:MAG: acyl-CoA dehydrogenase family protein [Sphingomicrobium sp.]
MDFEYSPDQVMLADSVTRFTRDAYPLAERPKLLAAYGRGEKSHWGQIAELGLLTLPMSEAQGGFEGTPSDIMAVAEALGHGLVPDPFISNAVLVAALLGEGNPDLLGELAAGMSRVALALGDGDSRFEHIRVLTTTEPRGSGAVLTGIKNHVPDGADADWFIIPARISGAADALDGISLYLVARNTPGLRVETFRGLDFHRHARLTLEAVEVGDAQLLGVAGGMGLKLGLSVKRAILAHCAEAVGAMDALRDITLEYLKTRKQFGQTIGSFQSLQHRMVDIAIACEEARAITYRATLEAEAGVMDKGRMTSAAKARVGQLALFVGRQAIQLHGGVGTSDELVVSHYYKRLMMIDTSYGNADHHKARFAKAA